MTEETVVLDEVDFALLKQRKPIGKKLPPKEVCEYDEHGVYLRTYKSIAETAFMTGVERKCIYRCCKGGSRIVSKPIRRIFLYRGDDIEERMALIEEIERSNYKYPKTIREYTLKGAFLRDFINKAQAARLTGLSDVEIGKCLRGTILYVGERIFLYSKDDIKERVKKIIDAKRKENFPGKPGRLVNMYDLNGKVLKLYPSISSAAKDNSISLWAVFDCCKGEKEGRPRLSVGDKIFLYDGDSIKNRLKEINKSKEL